MGVLTGSRYAVQHDLGWMRPVETKFPEM